MRRIAREMMKSRPPETPVAVIEKGSMQSQRVVTGTLADIAEKAERANLSPPAVTVIGRVVELRREFL